MRRQDTHVPRHRRERGFSLSHLSPGKLRLALGIGVAAALAVGSTQVADLWPGSQPKPASGSADRCPPADPDRLKAMQQRVHDTFAAARNRPITVPPADISQQIAAARGQAIADADPTINQLRPGMDPVTALRITNAYTKANHSLEATSGSPNARTVDEARQLLEFLDRTPSAFVRGSNIEKIVLQSPEPTESGDHAFIDWEDKRPDEPGIMHVADGMVDEVVTHEMEHGFYRRYSVNRCGLPRPLFDDDIEADNPGHFRYRRGLSRSLWQGVVVSQAGTTSPDEDNAEIAQFVHGPTSVEISSWRTFDTETIRSKIGVLALRYEDYSPGLGQWAIDHVAAHYGLVNPIPVGDRLAYPGWK